MREQDRYSPQENAAITVAPTTLGRLGVLDERQEVRGLLDANLLCARSQQQGSAAYIAFLDKSFRGNGLAELLDGVAPFGSGGRFGAEADFKMPQRALAQAGSDYEMSLHHDHKTDPVIGRAYQEFVLNHNERWLKALDIDPFEFIHDSVGFIDSDEVSARTFAERVEELKVLSQQRLDPEETVNAPALAHYGRALLMEEGRHKFGDYLYQRLEPGEEAPADWGKWSDYFKLSPQRQVSLLREYLSQLGKADQQEFAINYLLEDHNILIDPRKGKVWFTQGLTWVRGIAITVVDKTTVLIRKKVKDREEEATVTLETGESSKEEMEWEIKEVQRSNILEEMYGALAWERDSEGKRRFLSQEELLAMIPQDFEKLSQADVALGRVLAAYLSPNVTSRWPKLMQLPHRSTTAKQRMMGAQVPVWVSLDEHSSQLLSDENPLFGHIEEYIDLK